MDTRMGEKFKEKLLRGKKRHPVPWAGKNPSPKGGEKWRLEGLLCSERVGAREGSRVGTCCLRNPMNVEARYVPKTLLKRHEHSTLQKKVLAVRKRNERDYPRGEKKGGKEGHQAGCRGVFRRLLHLWEKGNDGRWLKGARGHQHG